MSDADALEIDDLAHTLRTSIVRSIAEKRPDVVAPHREELAYLLERARTTGSDVVARRAFGDAIILVALAGRRPDP